MKKINGFFILFFMCIHVKAQVSNHSYSSPELVTYSHLKWNAEVDFEKQQIMASATYQLLHKGAAEHFVLDVKGLDIATVEVDGAAVPWQLENQDPILGSALRIPITAESKVVTLKYNTTEKSDALLWVEGAHPFLFTQSQAILARTWIPCQDLPAVRFTYEASVTVPSQLLPLMSARNPKVLKDVNAATATYTFVQPKPIPSYLMALAVGNIVYSPISDRSGVYATPQMIQEAADELSDLEKMIAAAEALYGPYQWERFDVLILPPAFPFGGMENPMLTFATPTILAGDKSLVSLIAHELAHSWSGNLVTNETWNDFWLNEGFTVYFELRIMESLYGKEISEMLAALNIQDLYHTIAELHPNDTHLKLNLDGRDPDDGMNDIAYNKGYWLLRTIEERVGRVKFDRFLKKYFTEHAFQVMNTERFIEILHRELLDPGNAKYIGVNQWVYEPNIPDNAYPIVSDRIVKVDEVVSKYNNGEIFNGDIPWKNWTYQEQYRFLTNVKFASLEQFHDWDKSHQVSSTRNKEILFAWILKSIEMNDQSQHAQQVLTQFLGEVGRRKFIAPLYKKLIHEGRSNEAKNYLDLYKGVYHSVTRQTVLDFWK
ncbi:MAG: Aminopeptidase [Bacteroidota bacterium]|jgi:aminopeptidase N